MNSEKAEAEKQSSPVSRTATSVPVGDAIEDFHRRDDISFTIPAHRSGRTEFLPDAARWTGVGAFCADVGMTHGVDTRHQAWSVEPTAMELFADAVGADETLFSTNGSSQNVRVAIMAAVHPGDTLVMARNGHKSAFAGLVLSGAWPVYVDPDYDQTWQVAHGVDPAELGRVLDATPTAKAVMVFTPTYYGASADVSALAEKAHSHGLPLITDDAWGLDFAFCSRLPRSSMESGADLAIGSVHKSLAGLSQTSVLSRRGNRVDPKRLSLVFELEQSTSASSLLLLSIDSARRQFQQQGEKLIGRSIDLAERLRSEIERMPGLSLMGQEIVGRPGVLALDPTHVCFDVWELGLTGFSAADWLRQHHGIHLELSDHRRLMPLVTFADSDESIDRLVAALKALVEDRKGADMGRIPEVGDPAALRMETVMLPRDAFLGRTELVPWKQAAGRVSAEMICPYPPGIPVTAPGELLSSEAVEYLQEVVAAGAMVEGCADESLAELRVVAD
ncbi:MAG: DegT/DnrJ/EryC1/StrS family aminotransferase [Actinomycetota bacterium]|nr:DegT/DnrJ/EryC1/StrS family aminotransferase [Actinomycetota bacterium]